MGSNIVIWDHPIFLQKKIANIFTNRTHFKTIFTQVVIFFLEFPDFSDSVDFFRFHRISQDVQGCPICF